MSFILEALTRSEQARQQIVAAPKFSLLPAGGAEVVERRLWPYFVTVALVVNAAALYVWLNPAPPGAVAALNSARPTRNAEAPLAQERGVATRSAPELKQAPHGADVARTEARAGAWRPEGLGPERNPAPAKAPTGEPVARSANETPDRSATPPARKAIAERKVASAAAAGPAMDKAPAPRMEAASAHAPPSALPQEFPSVSVAGFIRDEGAGAMVIVNDKLWREGDEISPGLKLEKILPDGLLLNYKGQQFKR